MGGDPDAQRRLSDGESQREAWFHRYAIDTRMHRCWGADLQVRRGPVTPGAAGWRWAGRARYPELAAIERLGPYRPPADDRRSAGRHPTVLFAAAHSRLCGQAAR